MLALDKKKDRITPAYSYSQLMELMGQLIYTFDVRFDPSIDLVPILKMCIRDSVWGITPYAMMLHNGF